ncbi:MAG: ABC transporter ATP-binding protein/permease [Lachnospiraceae bacterium]|nr:ABC transporter ATP-binding protein/permease [Lachnospiraceae bacterium]
MNILKQIKGAYKRIYDIYTPQQRRGSIAVFVLLLIGSLLEMLGVSIIVPLVQVILLPESMLKNQSWQWLWQFLRVEDETGLVLWVSAGAVSVYIVKNVYMSFLSYYKNHFYRKVEKEISMRLMNSYLSREYTFHINTNTSVLLRSIVYDITGVSASMASIFTIIMESMSAVLIIIVLLTTDFGMAIVLAVSAMFALLVIVATFHKIMKVEGKRAVTYSQLCLKAVNEAFNGIKDVMVTRRQAFFAESYDEAVSGKNKSNAAKNFASECPAYVIEGICITAFIVMLCVKSLTGVNGAEFVSNAAAFAIAAFRILPSVGKITNNYNVIVYYQTMVGDVYKNIFEAKEFAQNNEPVMDEQDEQAVQGRTSSENVPAFHSEIRLENVSWKYPNAEGYVIEGLNMVIPKGHAVGFVGASGAGKTTLADMILGLLPTETGAIKMDGMDIKSIPVTWSRTIGYVPQSVYLTDDTIRNNVAFGIEKEQIDDALVWEALQQAQLKTFVESLPQGIDTIVGERGVKFSGGQRQRVAIARALYYDPAILVLDEATSALDNETESAVMEAIESLQGHKTLIIVAHRLTTIKSCDEVYEIADGKAVKKDMSENNHG